MSSQAGEGAAHREDKDTLAVRLCGRVNSLHQPDTQTAAVCVFGYIVQAAAELEARWRDQVDFVQGVVGSACCVPPQQHGYTLWGCCDRFIAVVWMVSTNIGIFQALTLTFTGTGTFDAAHDTQIIRLSM
jgi:nicotinamide riboside transporter PnuC